MDNNDLLSKTLTCVAAAGITYLIAKCFFYRTGNREVARNASDAFSYLEIVIVEDEKSCNEAVEEIRRKCTKYKAMGFDCEWVTNCGKRNPVALVQLSTYDGYCSLFRLNKLKTVPPTLKDLLEDERIYKLGVAPSDDAKYLFHDYSILLRSTLDIRNIADMCGHDPGGLGRLTKNLLGVILDKSWRIRCSDWESTSLSERQLQYAAADAHVAIRIYVKLMNEYCRSKCFWTFNEDEAWKSIAELNCKYLDIKFTSKKGGEKFNAESKEKKANKSPMGGKMYAILPRSKPLYHNCYLEAPDGEMLCTCDSKKLAWYVEKGLADVVKEDPLTVRLRFEPSGRSVGDVGRYYQLTKENKCVVCGNNNSYIRKNVVPREYRKYFPEIMKDHSSHDVVLLCVSCHMRSNFLDQGVRERLARVCDAPISPLDGGKFKEDADAKKIRSAARALLFQSKKHDLPESRREELESILKQYYKSEITEELLLEASNVQIILENESYEAHGQKVAKYYLQQDGGLLALEKIWREHFLASMKPSYMPELWSVNHNEERLRVKFEEGRLSHEDLMQVGSTCGFTRPSDR